MNENNQRLKSIRETKEVILKILPFITNQDVRKSLTNKKKQLDYELKQILKEVI